MICYPDFFIRTPESTNLQKTLRFNRHQVDRFSLTLTKFLMKNNFSANRFTTVMKLMFLLLMTTMSKLYPHLRKEERTSE